MRRIRVLHVIRRLAKGGTESALRKLLVGLDAERFEQSVCVLLEDPNWDVPLGMRVVCLKRTPGKPAFLVPQLTRVFSAEAPDIVHSRNWATIEAVPAARLAKVPAVIHSEHGLNVETMNREPWRRRATRRLCYGWSDKVFCVSTDLRRHYSRMLRVEPSLFDVIPNGVDTRRFCCNLQSREDVRSRLKASTSTLVIGTVSRLDPIKDHHTLIEAADTALAQGLDLRLVIVGDGSERPKIEQELAQRPRLCAHTVLVGETDDVSDWLNSFDVFVLTSLSEGMSNTLLEAMAVGVPAIATRVGGNPEIIHDGVSGLLVDCRDPGTISRYLRQLALDSNRRRELGENARQAVTTRFSLERMLQAYEEMYSQFFAAGHGARTAYSRKSVLIGQRRRNRCT